MKATISKLSPSILSKLSPILETLNDIPAINYGGCGISALAIYRWCLANGVPVSDRPFVVLLTEGDEWEVRFNSEILANGGDCRRLQFSHIGIEIEGNVYDSTGYVDREHYCLEQPERLSERELLESLQADDWNDWFSREKSIPEIEEALGIDLHDAYYEEYA